MKRRVIVAMSGGVDSSVAAALLVEQGYEVSGVTMWLWHEGDQSGDEADHSFSETWTGGARKVCEALGIPFSVLDCRQPFMEQVVEYFLEEYVGGRTPNPCVVCNRQIKFGLLLNYALCQGADFLATGHYARVRQVDGEYQLRRGVDRGKDQSYFLYVLGQRQLRHLLLPLGAYLKSEVRDQALKRGLPVDQAEESQDLCFVPDNDLRGFLCRQAPEEVVSGPIVDRDGRVIGQHHGLPLYTVGQRKGLGIAAPEPLYVMHLDAKRNTVVAGTAAELGRLSLLASDVTYVSGRYPEAPFEARARIRYRSCPMTAKVAPLPDERVEVTFDEPLRDIAPGQAVVFYRDEVVLGGGTISG